MSDIQNNSELIRKILSGAKWATTLRFIAQIISWISTVIVVRFISSHDYGLNAMLETPLEFLLLLSTLGLDSALARTKIIGKDELRSIFGLLLIVNFALFSIYFFGAGLIAAYFSHPRLSSLSRVLAVVFLFIPFRVIPNALLDRELKFKLRASVELSTSIFAASITLGLAVYGAGIWALVIGVISSRFLSAAILMILEPWFLWPSLNLRAAKNMVLFGGIMALAGAIVVISDRLPIMIAGPQLSAETIGIFFVSLQFAILPLSKVMPVINPVIFPAFSRFEGQPEAIAHYMEKSLGIAAVILLPIMIGLSCVSEDFVGVVLGEKWNAAVLPLAFLSLFMPFRGATSFLRQIISGVGFASVTLWSSLAPMILFFALLLFGTNYGVTGIVAAFCLTELFALAFTLLLSKKAMATSSSRLMNSLKPAVVSSIVMAVTVFFIKQFIDEQYQLLRLIVETSIGATVYFLTLILFFREKTDEILRVLKR
jgi:O-antigen/teichoic acid export membrane protein